MTFDAALAKYFRLVPSGPSWVTGIDISSSPRLPNWVIKAHAAAGTITSDPAVIANVSSSIDPSSLIDVTQHMHANGTLTWTPNNGTYTVVRMGHTITGQEMPATPDDQDGALSVDLFSKDAIDAHFDTFLARVIDRLKPYTPNTFYAFQVDSYEVGELNWGGDLEMDFLRLRGYSLRIWMLAATGRILGSAEQTEQFLFDFRLTHANLVAEKSYGYFRQRLAEHEVQLLSEPYGDGPFDSMEIASVVELAYGEFWSSYTYGSDGYAMLGQSSSEEKGFNFVPSEAFTGQPDDSAWTEFPYQLKAELDRMMTLGANRFMLHDFVHQPVDAAFPGMTFGPFGAHFDRMNTWTKQASGWTDYIARVSYVLQNSEIVTEINCFIGEEPSASPTVTYSSPYLVPLEYQAEIFSRADLPNMTAEDGKAVYPSGASFSLLVFLDIPSASAEVLTKLIEMARRGVSMLFLDTNATARSIGLQATNAEVTEFANQL